MSLTTIEIDKIVNQAIKNLQPEFAILDEISLYNQQKVLSAFRDNKIALRHFNGTTGYGYDDEGRDVLKRVYANVFKTESAVVSPNIVSGTHAISLGLYAILQRGNRVLSITGKPYDTLEEIISGNSLSLDALSIKFDYVNLIDAEFDNNKIVKFLKKNKYDMVYIQRSRGYEERRAISVYQIEKAIKLCRENGFEGCVFVDNCYGEFVEKDEPTAVGADVCVGSLIKNIGGGIAPTGGYLVGKEKYIHLVEARLTAPSICGEVGSYAPGYQYFYQGLFLAPHVVNQALKGSMLLGFVMEQLNYQTIPVAKEIPFDITRSVKLGDKQKLISFIQSVQKVSPIDSFLSCEPWQMPGYSDEVIMAAGCFVQGASIELSADAPIREPYIAYYQGGLTFEHSIIAIKEILSSL